MHSFWAIRIAPHRFIVLTSHWVWLVSLCWAADGGAAGCDDNTLDFVLSTRLHDSEGTIDCWSDQFVFVLDVKVERRRSVYNVFTSDSSSLELISTVEVGAHELELVEMLLECGLQWSEFLGIRCVADSSSDAIGAKLQKVETDSRTNESRNTCDEH